ncbi:lipoprotein signal peptidase [Flavobacteriales bacterium]|nr:lipoprotein signal peptidase [Flavobacteriales bacterium]
MRTVLITIFSVLFIDQVLKLWVKANFFLGEEIGGLGFIKLQFIENPGMAFGMEFGGVWGKIALSLFRVGAVVVIWFIIKNLLNNKAHKGLVFSVGLIFAGALGNILDSAFYGLMFSESSPYYMAEFMPEAGGYANFMTGHVVDMIHFKFHYPSWTPFDMAGSEIFPPVFNIADFAISVGVGIIIVFNKRFLGKGKGDFSVFRKQQLVTEDPIDAEVEK